MTAAGKFRFDQFNNRNFLNIILQVAEIIRKKTKIEEKKNEIAQ